jgi:UDP-sugar pyrophosphorylase
MAVADAPAVSIRGIPFTPGPRVILRPSFALTLAEVKERVKGGAISGTATLVLDGDIRLENVTVPDGSTLVVSAVPGASVTVKNLNISPGPTYLLEELGDAELASGETPEYLRIRGYRIVDQGVNKIAVEEKGRWEIDGSSARKIG